MTGMVPMTSVCPDMGSWASWACAGWCGCVGSDVKPEHTTEQSVNPPLAASDGARFVTTTPALTHLMKCLH